MAVDSKRLVIDASVARASGGEGATHPVAVASRDFLAAVLDICHKVVMISPMQEEWNNHQSNFARKWRRGMVARKKLIAFPDGEQSAMRLAIDNLNVGENQKQAMFKDCHLIEAALGNDYSVVSLDATAGSLFCSVSSQIHGLQNVLWIDPSKNHQQSLEWLKGGASHESELSHHWRLESSNSIIDVE